METMDTLTDAISQLRFVGYTEDFNLSKDCICNSGNRVRLKPDEFVIDKYYRFEGASDPDDEAIVYAISSANGQVKGVLVNSYGIYSDDLTDELVKKLKLRQ